jgi:hypothetical protein
MRACFKGVLLAFVLSCLVAVPASAQDAGLPPLGKDAIEHVGQVVSKYDKFTDKSKIELALLVKGEELNGIYLVAFCIYSGQVVPDNAKVVLGVLSVNDKFKFETNNKIILLADGQRQVYDPQRFQSATDNGTIIELLLIPREFSVDELLTLASSSSFAGRAGGYDEFDVGAGQKRTLLEFARRMQPRSDQTNSDAQRVPLIELPSNFHYNRELGKDTGLAVYTLTPDDETMAAATANGEEFQALGVLAQPDAKKVGLIFYSAARQFQLQINQAKGFYLTMDKEVVHVPTYLITGQREAGKLKMEVAGVQISNEVLWKLLRAEHVTAQCGMVVYELDRDNIEALRYLAIQIEKDAKTTRY